MSDNIKILSGWSASGGSTEAFINLTNGLNSVGYNTIFYGPHSYHLDKCKAGLFNEMSLNNEDILICHFINFGEQKLPNKKIILSCHEKNLFPLQMIHNYWDIAVFLNEAQRDYHKYTKKHVIIPNLKQTFNKIDKSDKDMIAGIVGNIDANKQIHISIGRALKDSCEKVYIFGEVRDPNYFNTFVKPLLSDKVIHKGYIQDKQEMYNSIGRVYNSSISEVASLTKDECYSTGTKFFGNDATSPEVSTLTNKEILELWIKLFKE